MKALVVDDEKLIVKGLKFSLEQEGYEVDCAYDGQEAVDKAKAERSAAEERERRLQRATLALQDRFGKNVLLKGMNYMDGGTTIERNEQIGGHRAGRDEVMTGRPKKKPYEPMNGGDEDE